MYASSFKSLILFNLIFLFTSFFLVTSIVTCQENTVKVGFIAPLSGGYERIGQGLKNAVLMAENVINADSKRKFKVKVILEDGTLLPADAIRAFEKFRDTVHVHYIIGPFSFGQVVALGPLADASKIIVLANHSKASEIAQAGEYVFRVTYNASDENAFLGSAIAGRMHGDVLHSIGPNSPITDTTIEQIKSSLEKNGKKMDDIEKFPYRASDMRPQMLRLRRKKPKDILLIGNEREVGTLLRHGAELKLSATYFTSFINEEELLASSGEFSSGLLYSFPYSEEVLTPIGKEFHESYKRSYGGNPSYEAASTFDALMTLDECIEKEGDLVESVKKCLFDTKAFHGATGVFNFDLNGDAKRVWSLKEITSENSSSEVK